MSGRRTHTPGTPLRVEVAIVGGGPAGLAASSELARAGVRHVVLERDRIGSTWRNQRWESFRLNSPTWANRVPGQFLGGPDDGFATAASLVTGLEAFASTLPVIEGMEVLSAERIGPMWRLETSRKAVLASTVVVASGFQNVPSFPHFAAALPASVKQLHAADYRHPSDVHGAALVVGGGQSGVQIAEDLLPAGTAVYLSTSRVARLPRRHRGRDAFEWLRDTGQLDLPTERAEASAIGAAPPQVSGVDGGRTVSYQALARRGAILVGRLQGVDGNCLQLARDVGANVRFADEKSFSARAKWDEFRPSRGSSGDEDRDVADEPDESLYGISGPEALDLRAAGIKTVIWATGFRPSTEWLPNAAVDANGRTDLAGLHAIGAPWLMQRSSASLYGIAADAERVAATIAEGTVVTAAAA